MHQHFQVLEKVIKLTYVIQFKVWRQFILTRLEKKIERFYLFGHSMGGMIVQEMVKLAGEKILKLICYGTGSRGNIPARFETINVSRDKLKTYGLDNTVYRIAKTWLIEEDKSKYFLTL